MLTWLGQLWVCGLLVRGSRAAVLTQLFHTSLPVMTTSWPPSHLKTSLVPTSTVISFVACGSALQKPELATPITRSVVAAARSAVLVRRSKEVMSAPATKAAVRTLALWLVTKGYLGSYEGARQKCQPRGGN